MLQLGVLGEVTHTPRPCPSSTVQALKQGEDTTQHANGRSMKGSPDDRLKMAVASSLFMNFVL